MVAVHYVYVAPFDFLLGGNVAGLVGSFLSSFSLSKKIALQRLTLRLTSFQQYSALYPELVDGIVLLDSYGFLPTDQVLHNLQYIRVYCYTFRMECFSYQTQYLSETIPRLLKCWQIN